jgi:hypothetical protein
MKTQLILTMLLVCTVTGCTHRYVVVLSRGTTITAKGKPRLDKSKNCYVFTDMKGREQEIPAASVREISPASMRRDSTIPPAQTIPAR